MGIKGSGAAGVALLAQKMGYRVTGCDLQTGGHDIRHLKGVDLVVATPAVFYQSAKGPEFLEARKRGILVTWQEFLGKTLLAHKKVIAVAGTHGKSTTTAMVAKLLIDNGFDPIAVVGAKVPEWKGNSRFGKGEWAVVEADEFNDNFLNYRPDILVINNIEFDHPDYFRNLSQIKSSFAKLKHNLKGKKILITQNDNLHRKFNLQIWGRHNQNNANMAFLVGKALKIPEIKTIKSLASFKGIGRRMELIGEKKGVKIYDDYAHHPTAIKTTLEGLRNHFPSSRIWTVVEEHGFARTKALLSLYQGVFDAADKVIVGPIFKARDSQTFGMSPEKIVVASGHRDGVAVGSIEQVVKILRKGVRRGDVILVMGAGQSDKWVREIARSI